MGRVIRTLLEKKVEYGGTLVKLHNEVHLETYYSLGRKL